MTARRIALAALALMFAAAPASAELAVLINNRSCGPVTVELPDAPPCGADGKICSAVARNGFTTRLAVDQSFNEDYLRLVIRGECGARNMKLAGDCTVKVRKISRVETYTPDQGGPIGMAAVAVTAQATLITLDLVQGICDNDNGERRCEMTCRSRDQQ